MSRKRTQLESTLWLYWLKLKPFPEVIDKLFSGMFSTPNGSVALPVAPEVVKERLGEGIEIPPMAIPHEVRPRE